MKINAFQEIKIKKGTQFSFLIDGCEFPNHGVELADNKVHVWFDRPDARSWTTHTVADTTKNFESGYWKLIKI